MLCLVINDPRPEPTGPIAERRQLYCIDPLTRGGQEQFFLASQRSDPTAHAIPPP